MQMLPGLEAPISMAGILRRHLAATEAAREPPPEVKQGATALSHVQADMLPLASPRRGARQWARHELPKINGYELRLDGAAIVRVRPADSGWQVTNLGAGCTRALPSAGAARAASSSIRCPTCFTRACLTNGSRACSTSWPRRLVTPSKS